MNPIPRVLRTFSRGARPPRTGEPPARQPHGQEPDLLSRPGRDGLAERFLPHVAACASVTADQNRPAPTTTNSRRHTITTTRLLPHTIQLCIHCRHNPAGFWVSRIGDQTARRPWCLSCCQDLDPARHHIRPFDLRPFDSKPEVSGSLVGDYGAGLRFHRRTVWLSWLCHP